MNRRDFLKAVLASAAGAVLSPTLPLVPLPPRETAMETCERIVMESAGRGEMTWQEATDVIELLHEPGPHRELLEALDRISYEFSQ